MRLTAQFPVGPLQGFRLSTPEYLEFREMNQSFAGRRRILRWRRRGGRRLGRLGGRGQSDGRRSPGARALRAGRHPPARDARRAARAGTPLHRRPRPTPCRRARASAARRFAILSHELWQSAFGGQPIVGLIVQVDGRPHDIIGIMPPGFDVMDNRTADLAADRHPPGDSPTSRESHPPGDRAAEGRRHAAGGRRRAHQIPRHLGRAHRRLGPRADRTSVASAGSHASSAAAAGRDSRRRAVA